MARSGVPNGQSKIRFGNKGDKAITEHRTGTREEWRPARKELLERENEHAKESTDLSRQRQELPWVRVEGEYAFETGQGTKTLAELFDGRSQLLAYHLMFGPDYAAARPGCSNLADHLDGGVTHLNHRDVTFLCISRAPIEKLQAYKRRMGWKFPWVSSFGSDFNFGFGFSPPRRVRGLEIDTVVSTLLVDEDRFSEPDAPVLIRAKREGQAVD